MRFTSSATALFTSLLLTSSVFALEYTTTLPYEDGNTLVVSVGTNARGVSTTATLSTIEDDGITSALTASTTTTTGKTTTTKKTTTSTGPVTTTGQRVVGEETTAAPMRTTTYWVNQADGTWTDFTWTASVTAAPTVATANVPSGTILAYDSYQSSANSVVLAAAESSASTAAGMRRSAPAGMTDAAMGGWVTMVLGAVGAGVGVLAL